MFWKNVADFKAGSGSIARYLTTWYALLSLALIITFSGVMYSVLKNRLRSEDDQVLAGKLAEIRAVLAHRTGDYTHLREEVEREATTSPGTYLAVLNGQGEVIAESGANDALAVYGMLFTSMPSQVNERGYDWVANDGRTYRVMTSKFTLDTRYTLHAVMNLSNEEHLLATYWRTLSVVVIISLVIAAVIGYVIARKGMKPVSRLAAIVDELNVHGLHRRVGEEEWPEELKPLAGKFNSLLSRLEESFLRLSRFSADIAHELRTPLHILRGEAEFALTRERTIEELRNCMESAAEEYDRLSRMVEALLFLARSEQPDVHLVKRSLDIAQEFSAICDFYQAMADEQGVILAVSGSGKVLADSDLLRRALGNLIVNSISSTPSGGKITVYTSAGPNDTVEISINDTGSGIASKYLPHIFDRFYRIDGARRHQEQRVGLGLAIVHSIMQLHQGSVSIQSALGEGTTVTLSFPHAKEAA